MSQQDRGEPQARLPLLDRAIRHDRAIVLGAVATVAVLAGLYTAAGVGMDMSAFDMTQMARGIGTPMAMGTAPAWSPPRAILIFLMWWVMMIAMMTPSAAPTLLLFSALKRASGGAALALAHSGLFLAGYLLCWALFSVAATALQWLLQSAGLIAAAMMTIDSGAMAGAVLVAAGLYQFTPLKTACLRHCRSPAQFLTEHRRGGASGAMQMGMHHGIYCVGCCWALMALLFVGGIMNLYWIAGIAALVAIEKTAPFGRLTGRVVGVALIGLGGWVGYPG